MPTLLIFKGVANGKIYLDLKKNFYVKNNKIFIECNSNSWCNKDIRCVGIIVFGEKIYRLF